MKIIDNNYFIGFYTTPISYKGVKLNEMETLKSRMLCVKQQMKFVFIWQLFNILQFYCHLIAGHLPASIWMPENLITGIFNRGAIWPPCFLTVKLTTPKWVVIVKMWLQFFLEALCVLQWCYDSFCPFFLHLFSTTSPFHTTRGTFSLTFMLNNLTSSAYYFYEKVLRSKRK